MPTAASGFADQQPIVFSLVYVNEVEASAGSSPQEWLLQISLAVTDFSEAKAVAHRYLFRWWVEDWHRILKSGCKVEISQYWKGERIERAVTINEVITWRAGSYDSAWQGNSKIACYMNRKNDLPLSYEIIWEGYIWLVNLSQAVAYRMKTKREGWLRHKLSSD